jgi:hypothetical protein
MIELREIKLGPLNNEADYRRELERVMVEHNRVVRLLRKLLERNPELLPGVV